MDFLAQLVDLVLHVDKHLVQLTDTYGVLMYAILFAIVFLETGVVVTPFLPGDSLLFAAGAIAAVPGSALNVHLLFLLLWVAAVAGDSLNYAIGNRLGPRVFREEWRFLSRKHLLRTQAFYEKHGGKTIFLARFVPIVRTFAPFVAGIGRMSYPRFLAFSVAGGTLWVAGFALLGYFFGGLPIVKENFSVAVVVVIFTSLVPMVVEVWKARRERSRARARGPS